MTTALVSWEADAMASDPPHDYSIDELAAHTGIPSRTIRFYQSKGALPTPERRGRKAFYTNAHVERLALIGAINGFWSAGGCECSDFDAFVAQHPASVWTPAVNYNAGHIMARRGRDSQALIRWQQAWNATKSLSDANSKKIADAALLTRLT